MLKPINPIANRVAEGRRYASRSIVITSLSAISSVAYRRQIVPTVEDQTREESLFIGGMALSDIEEHAVEYEDLGHAMVLFDHFTGGSIHSNGDDINSGEAVFYAQIEPFNFGDYGKRHDMLRNNPDWKPKKGDVFALIIAEDTIKWVEVIGVSGQSVHAHHGEHYILNVRDKLMHLEPFISQENVLKPENEMFPMPLAELAYHKAAMYEIYENDPQTMSDDQVVMKNFKLVNIADPNLRNYPAVLAVSYLNQQTQLNCFFNAEDQNKITVNVGNGEIFILSSDEPVNAIEIETKHISYMMIITDNVNLVAKIKKELISLNAVQVLQAESVIFEILPLHYDELRKAYHFVCPAILGEIAHYELTFMNGDKYSVSIDAQGLGAV